MGDQTYALASLAGPLRKSFPDAEIDVQARFPLIGVPASLEIKDQREKTGYDDCDLVIVTSADNQIKSEVVENAKSFIMPLEDDASWSPHEKWLCRQDDEIFVSLAPEDPRIYHNNHPYFFGSVFPRLIGLDSLPKEIFLEAPMIETNDFLMGIGYENVRGRAITEKPISKKILLNMFTAKYRSIEYEDHWRALASSFSAKKRSMIVEGGINEDQLTDIREMSWPVSAFLPSRWITADELLSLIGCVSLLVGIDSAPTHLAAGLGVPSITFFSEFSPESFSYFDRPAFHFELDYGQVSPVIPTIELSDILLRRTGWLAKYGLSDEQARCTANRIVGLAAQAIEETEPSAIFDLRRELADFLTVLRAEGNTELLGIFQQELNKISEKRCLSQTKTALFDIRLSNYYKLVRWLSRFSS